VNLCRILPRPFRLKYILNKYVQQIKYQKIFKITTKVNKGKAVSLQTRIGPEGSSK